MKFILLVSILLFCSSVGFAQIENTPETSIESNLKLNELASLPDGLIVIHTPDPVYYTLYSHNISGVQWLHSTSVSTKSGPVKIVEFGYFVERNGTWELSYGDEVPRRYSSTDFASRYGCPNAELRVGETYTDAENRSVIDCVPEQVVKWYYIGLDAKGNRVKGEANVKLLAELAKERDTVIR